jgi:hypothetical protein
MIVTVNIQGAGVVNGIGEYATGMQVVLEAIPATSMSFKGFLSDGGYFPSPYEFTAGADDVTVTAVFFMPIESFLKNLVGYPLSDEQIYAIMVKRGIPFGVDSATVSQKLKDLAYADLIMTIVTTASEGSTKEQMGNWSSQKGSRVLTGKNELIKTANGIYDKYGEKRTGVRFKDATKRW